MLELECRDTFSFLTRSLLQRDSTVSWDINRPISSSVPSYRTLLSGRTGSVLGHRVDCRPIFHKLRSEKYVLGGYKGQNPGITRSRQMCEFCKPPIPAPGLSCEFCTPPIPVPDRCVRSGRNVYPYPGHGYIVVEYPVEGEGFCTISTSVPHR